MRIGSAASMNTLASRRLSASARFCSLMSFAMVAIAIVPPDSSFSAERVSSTGAISRSRFQRRPSTLRTSSPARQRASSSSACT